MHIDYAINQDCLNPFDSYGEICIHCNACGRFGKETMLQDRLEVYKRHLQEQIDFDGWWEECRELQEKNRDANIEYYKKLIQKTEAEIEKRKEMGS